jgi:hypothetical protein
MQKPKDIVKRYSFSNEERDQLQNIQIGIINAQATNDGLHFFKNALLGSVYKRLGIDKEPQKGYSKSIAYNLSENVITYTQSPIVEKPIAKK